MQLIEHLHSLSIGMPILYIVTSISFFLQYWAEKWELIRLSRRPATYGRDLADMAGALLPYAAVWHLGFSMWAFSFYRTSLSPAVSEASVKQIEWLVKLINNIFEFANDLNPREVSERLLQKNAAHHFAGLVVVLVVLVAKVGHHSAIHSCQQASNSQCFKIVHHGATRKSL